MAFKLVLLYSLIDQLYPLHSKENIWLKDEKMSVQYHILATKLGVDIDLPYPVTEKNINKLILKQKLNLLIK